MHENINWTYPGNHYIASKIDKEWPELGVSYSIPTVDKEIWIKRTSGDNYTILYKDGSSLEHNVSRGVNGFTSDTIRDVITNADGSQEITETISTGTGGIFGRTSPSLPQRATTTYPDGSKKVIEFTYYGTDNEDFLNGGSGNPSHQRLNAKQYDKEGNLIGSEIIHSNRWDVRTGAQDPDDFATYIPTAKRIFDADGRLIEEYDAKGSTSYLENKTYTYDETGALFSAKVYNKEGMLIASSTAPTLTFGGQTYTFNAMELTAIRGSLDSGKQVIADALSGISSKCSSLAGTVSSADSGLSGTLNNLSQLCENCQVTIDRLLTNLSADIATYVSNTISNEQGTSVDLNYINSEINDIMNTFNSNIS